MVDAAIAADERERDWRNVDVTGMLFLAVNGLGTGNGSSSKESLEISGGYTNVAGRLTGLGRWKRWSCVDAKMMAVPILVFSIKIVVVRPSCALECCSTKIRVAKGNSRLNNTDNEF